MNCVKVMSRTKLTHSCVPNPFGLSAINVGGGMTKLTKFDEV